MARETLVVRDLGLFLKASARAERDVNRETRAALRDVGEVARRDSSRRFAPINARSAAGYKTRVRQKGIAVEQSLRKTTGKHPEYGALQMRKALLPALMSNQDELERELERAIDRIADRFERKP